MRTLLGDIAISLANLDLAHVLISLVVLLFSLSIHESAHAWTADRLGDPTGRHLGRVSLNPLVHIDPIGTVVFPLIAAITGVPLIGWAKPVPVNPANLKNPRRDHVYIAAAGPGVNLIAGCVFLVLLRVILATYGQVAISSAGIITPVFKLLLQGVFVNFLLAIFNLIPIPPLDGSWILSGLLPLRLSNAYNRLRPYGGILLLVLVYTRALNVVFQPLVDTLEILIQI